MRCLFVFYTKQNYKNESNEPRDNTFAALFIICVFYSDRRQFLVMDRYMASLILNYIFFPSVYIFELYTQKLISVWL